MDKELAYIILLPVSSFLFMLGGWRWKGWRRFVLPICLLSVCLLYSVPLAQALAVAILCMIVTSLPYGENSTWTMRIITAISFGMIGLPLGFDFLMIIPPVVFLTGWLFSNKYGLQHKIVEGLSGIAIALPIANMLYLRG